MADKRDYYEVLGVDRNATDEEIKKAFCKAAKTCHPDLNPGDKAAEQKFKEVNEAYSVLSDKEKKQRYDQFGHAGVDPSYGAGGPGAGGYGQYGGGDFGDIFGDIFGDMFGGGRARRANPNAPVKGRDITISLSIEFLESVFGCKRTIRYRREEVCADCKGTGAHKGEGRQTCPTCGGTGQVRTQQRTILGSFTSVSTCSHCGGTGQIIKDPCKVCGGKGYTTGERTIEASIPGGIASGQSIKLAGQGSAGRRGGAAGDLYITVTVKPHILFQRQGNDISYDVPITMVQAASGCTLELPTIDGNTVRQVVPEGTQNQTVFKIKNYGVPYINGRGRGDMYIRVLIEVPRNLNKKQKELLAEFEKAAGSKSYESVRKYQETVSRLKK